MWRLLAALLFVAPALAGCLDGPTTADLEDLDAGAPHWALAALVSDHDHADAALHADLSTPNFQIVGHAPLISEDYGTTVQGNLCGDVSETSDGRRLAVVETRGDVAFSLVDVTDAAAPLWLGEMVLRTTYVYDLAVVPDGKHVVLVTSTHKTPDRDPAAFAGLDLPAGDGLYWRSPCAPGGMAQWHQVTGAVPGEDLVPRPTSTILVSIADAAEPRIVDQKPLGGFGHGVSSMDAYGRTWVVAAALGCTVVAGCPSHLQTWHFYHVVDTPVGAQLELQSVFSLPLEAEPLNSGHNDAWIQVHPATGRLLAYLAAWDHGLLILDLSDASRPELVGQWTDHDPSRPPEDTGKVHSAHPLSTMWDGRHYTVVGPELVGPPSERPTGVIYVLDTTDPAEPFAVAAWTLPHQVTWEERLHWSTHYLTVSGRTAFVSTYHGGVWALDLSTLSPGMEPTLLEAVGAFLPTYESPAPPEDPFRWTPTLEEVHAFDDGTLVTFDSNSGLYAFTFDEATPAAPPTPWPLDGFAPAR